MTTQTILHRETARQPGPDTAVSPREDMVLDSGRLKALVLDLKFV